MTQKQKTHQKILSFIKKKGCKIKNYFFSRRFVIFLGVFFGLTLICYVLLLFFAKDIETNLTFPATHVNLKEISNHPAGLIVAKSLELRSSSGEKITGIYIDNNSEKVVYYFHGNGAPLEYFYSDVQYISDLGYSVIAIEYPGYGESTGKPTFSEISDVAHIFYEHMREILGFEEKNMIVWGYSVGTAVAIEFAKDKDFDALVLFSPLASRYDMGQKLLGFPLQKIFFLPNSFVSKETIKHITEPTLIIHGNTDKVVPFWQGKLVYENAASDNKYFIEIDNFGHSLIPERYGDVLISYIENFLENYSLQQTETFLDKELAIKLLEKFQTEKRLISYDIFSDDSYQKYVDSEVSYSELGYIPLDLRALESEFIISTKADTQMREQAAKKLEEMAQDFYEALGEKIVVVSSYRSYSYQAGIKARGCSDIFCAKAGYSEHQGGLAVDFWSASTKEYWNNSPRLTKFYQWLWDHAHTYGFHNSYQNGREIDGYAIEPWHWRYVGEELASYLREENITFAQYYDMRINK